jgi:UDPglucose--hexose-1-phosphate uridylyltransferase
MNSILENSHIRKNILTSEEVLVSPHRTKRPWQGQQEEVSKMKRPSHDDSCYLCAGNTRANGEVNPKYKDTFVFTNDFAALQKDSKAFTLDDGLLQAHSERGICKVICFSPDHSKSLAEMSIDEILKVVAVWKDEFKTLSQEDIINYV